MLKIQKTMRLEPKLVKEFEELKKLSGGYLTLTTVVENGLRRELAELRKTYKKK